jgi:hypothetical protein
MAATILGGVTRVAPFTSAHAMTEEVWGHRRVSPAGVAFLIEVGGALFRDLWSNAA